MPAYTLPDPLRFEDGTPVATRAAWRGRRSELLGLFAAHVYGRTPEVPAAALAEPFEFHAPALGGSALRSQWRVFLLGDRDGPWMDLLLYLPAGASAPAPVFLGLNFWGNHTVHPDPCIRLSESWMRDDPSRSVRGHRALPSSRGESASRWPVERILARGYGLATAYAGDLDPDFDDGFRNGVHAAFPEESPRPSDAWGAIGAWAFGLMRARGVLASEARVDGARIAALGHSRLGKAALWAGAQDEGFAAVFSNGSGCGGAALSRRLYGETVQAITTRFPHWFAPAFARYAEREAKLPVDQHQLLALIAPRPLYVASAAEDAWADPKGELLAARAAEPVYRLLGREPRLPEAFPAPGTATSGPIGHHLRPGAHDLTGEDWEHFLAFADAHLRTG